MNTENIFWCKGCLNMSTRPRIEIDKDGYCNACNWVKEKKTLNWSKREQELKQLIKDTKSSSIYDCIVPVSGGKDGTYVTHQLKKRYNLKPLCITVKPPMELEIGKKNLENFIKEDIDHMHISPSLKAMSALDTVGFLDYGQGYYGWMTALHSAIVRIANNLDINLIIYGEDGEVEYGGTTKHKYDPCYGIDHMKKVFLNNTYEDIMKKSNLSDSDKYWFSFPKNYSKNIKITHYSYFENWDPYQNYLLAKEKYGLEDLSASNTGTFTNFAHNDQALSALHYYLMYIKFGFGRATQDAGIEIRRGAMTRDQAINLVNLYDGVFPEEHVDKYLEYFGISDAKFFENIDKWANKKLFEKKNSVWKPKFKII